MFVPLVCLAVACRSTSSVPSAGADAVAARPSEDPESIEPIEATDEPWLAALRVSDYRAAASAFDQVHPAPTASRLRFVRATIAFELQDHARVVALCPGLAETLPQVARRVERLCLLSQVASAPTLDSARQLAAADDFDDAMIGVEALVELEAYAEARQALEPLTLRVKGSPSRLARARRISGELWERLGKLQLASSDFEWLALQAAAEPASAGADVEYERLSGRRLTKSERHARAEAYTKRGDLERSLAELDAIATAPGAAVPRVEVLRTRAWAHYRSRSGYATASELFTQCAKLDPAYRTQDLFYAARALSRAHRDEEAIARYDKLARERPEGSYTEEARYLIGHLRFVLGQWDEAVTAHGAYLARYESRARFGATARYDMAIAHLARGRGERAAPLLEALVRETSSERRDAQLRELLGLAYMQQGHVAQATSVFQQVIVERPLSFAALTAAQRLEQLGLPPPPAIPRSEPEPRPPPLDVALPDSVRWFAGLGLHLEAERELSERAEHFKQRHAPRGAEALCLAYDQLAVAKERYRHAQRAIRERALQRSITDATQWIWHCIYPTPYADAVRQAERKHDLPAGLVHAVMRQESAFAPAVGSPAGAQGLMQLMPATASSAARELGWVEGRFDLHVPAHNIELGSFYLGRLLRMFDAQVPLAAAGYNAGPGAVSRWLEAAHQLPIDVFVAYIPYRETREYVQRVVGNWARYRYLAGGERALPRLALDVTDPVALSSTDY